MWYILMFLALLLPLTAYIKMKSLARLRRRKTVPLIDRLLANEPAVIFSACLVLVVIGLSIVFSMPGTGEVREASLRRELAWQRLMARQLGAKLADSLAGKASVLIIDQDFGEPEKRYHQALVEGLMEGLGDKGELGAEVFATLASVKANDPTAANESLTFTGAQLDRWVREHPECTVVVSFIGLPGDYPRSTTMFGALDGKLTVGVFTTTVYTLGETIYNRGVHACVVPRLSYVDENMEPNLADPAKAFDNRFLLIDRDNLKDVIKENRRIIKMTRVIY